MSNTTFASMDIVIKEQEGVIVTLILNRPEKRNALNKAVVDTLKQYFTELNEDDGVRVIILRANGESFCAGADLEYMQELQNNNYEENLADSKNLAELFTLIYTHSKIIISQVEGAALAGGCGLATVCDLCYATPGSKFGYTEVKIGFIPAIVSFFLLRKIGEARSKLLLLSGKIIDASNAWNIGLINEVIESGKIHEIVFQIAQRLASETSPSSIMLTKKLINDIQGLGLYDAMWLASERNAEARATEDCKRGIAAFLNREKLTW